MSWRRTLWILWAAQFSVTSGMSLVIPFLPLYVAKLGVHDVGSQELWSSWIFAANFVTSVVFQPIWGSFADRHGRKIMLLRAGFGMCVVTFLMGMVTAPWQLLVLRLVNGIFAGFISMAVSLQASITPDEHSGKALGILQTGAIAGTLIGPLLGGSLAYWFGYSIIFMITSCLLMIASLVVLFFVKENREEQNQHTGPRPKQRNNFRRLRPLLPVFFASFVTQLGMMSIEPIVSIYTKLLYHGGALEIIAGLVVAVTGTANLIGSPTLGRLGDKIGQRRTLAIALTMAAVAFIPQALAQNVGMLLVGRFMLGLFVGGMIPSLNVLVKKIAPRSIQATAFGFNSSSLFLGNLIGPLIGGQVAAHFGIRWVFVVTMAILLSNAFIIINSRRLDHHPAVT